MIQIRPDDNGIARVVLRPTYRLSFYDVVQLVTHRHWDVEIPRHIHTGQQHLERKLRETIYNDGQSAVQRAHLTTRGYAQASSRLVRLLLPDLVPSDERHLQ